LKFTIVYNRKVRVQAYETLEIGLIQEFDDSQISWLEAFTKVKMFVNYKVKEERAGLLKESVWPEEERKSVQSS